MKNITLLVLAIFLPIGISYAMLNIFNVFTRAQTELHSAAQMGNITACRRLLNKGFLVDPLDENDNTPLHYAAGNGQFQICELLIAHGANRLVKNCRHLTPYDLLVDESNSEYSQGFDESYAKIRFLELLRPVHAPGVYRRQLPLARYQYLGTSSDDENEDPGPQVKHYAFEDTKKHPILDYPIVYQLCSEDSDHR